MALSLNDYRAMMKGFEEAGFICTHAPAGVTNPLRVEWQIDSQVRRYRL
jgi:hypothetical protein